MITDKEELKDFLVTEAEYDQIEVDEMSDFELLDSYLQWYGIMGWTGDILDAVNAIYGVNIDY